MKVSILRTICLSSLVAACGWNTPPPNARQLSVDFSFDTTRPCSNESPAIDVFNAPVGTTKLRIQYVHVDALLSNTGTSEVEYKGTRLPAGALTDYRGPCPLGGKAQSVTYDIRVTALDTNGEVVGFGATRRTYTPPKLLGSPRI